MERAMRGSGRAVTAAAAGTVQRQRRFAWTVMKDENIIPKYVKENPQVKERWRFMWNHGGKYTDYRQMQTWVTRKNIYYRDKNLVVSQFKHRDTAERTHDLAALGDMIAQDAGDANAKPKAIYQLHPSDVVVSPAEEVRDIVLDDIKDLKVVYDELYFTLYSPGRRYGGVEAAAEALQQLGIASFMPVSPPTWMSGAYGMVCRAKDVSPVELARLNEDRAGLGLRIFNISSLPPHPAAMATQRVAVMLRGIPRGPGMQRWMQRLSSLPSHRFPNYVGWDLVGVGPEAGVFSSDLSTRVGLYMLSGAYDDAARAIVRGMLRVNSMLKAAEVDLEPDRKGESRITAAFYSNIPPRYGWVKQMLDFMANYTNKKWPEPALTKELPFEIVGRFPAAAAAHMWNAALDKRMSIDSRWAVDGDYIIDETTGEVTVYSDPRTARARHERDAALVEREMEEERAMMGEEAPAAPKEYKNTTTKPPAFIKPKSLTELLDDHDIESAATVREVDADADDEGDSLDHAAAVPPSTSDPGAKKKQKLPRRVPIARVVIPTVGSGFRMVDWPLSLGGEHGFRALAEGVGLDRVRSEIFETAVNVHLQPTTYRPVVAEATNVGITVKKGAMTGYTQNYRGEVLRLRAPERYYSPFLKARIYGEMWECLPCGVVNHEAAIRCKSCDGHRTRILEEAGTPEPPALPMTNVLTAQITATLPASASPAAFVGEYFHLHTHVHHRMDPDLTTAIKRSLELGKYAKPSGRARHLKRRRPRGRAQQLPPTQTQLPAWLQDVECGELRFTAPSNPVASPTLQYVVRNNTGGSAEDEADTASPAAPRPGSLPHPTMGMSWHNHGRTPTSRPVGTATGTNPLRAAWNHQQREAAKDMERERARVQQAQGH